MIVGLGDQQEQKNTNYHRLFFEILLSMDGSIGSKAPLWDIFVSSFSKGQHFLQAYKELSLPVIYCLFIYRLRPPLYHIKI